MFSNETYSILYGLFRKIEPFLTIWYVYLYFFKLYPRMAKASLVSMTYHNNPSAVKNITNGDVVAHTVIIQSIAHVITKVIGNRKKE